MSGISKCRTIANQALIEMDMFSVNLGGVRGAGMVSGRFRNPQGFYLVCRAFEKAVQWCFRMDAHRFHWRVLSELSVSIRNPVVAHCRFPAISNFRPFARKRLFSLIEDARKAVERREMTKCRL
jgi:hypothetical protein